MFTLADRVLVLESSRISEIGTVGKVVDVLSVPCSHFGVRILLGANLVNGSIGTDSSLLTRSDAGWHETPAQDLGDELAAGQDAVAVFV